MIEHEDIKCCKCGEVIGVQLMQWNEYSDEYMTEEEYSDLGGSNEEGEFCSCCWEAVCE